MATYVHVGSYVGGFVDGQQRYAVTTTRADGAPILPPQLDNAKRANRRAAASLTSWRPADMITRGIRTSVRVGSFMVSGADYASVETIARGE